MGMDEHAHELEKRVTALEIARGETTVELRAMNGKLDQVVAQTAAIAEGFVSTPTCFARQENVGKDLNNLGDETRKLKDMAGALRDDFGEHIRYHWQKSDRYVSWITALLMATFVVGKIAKAW